MSCRSSLGPLLSSLRGCRAHLESGPGPGSPLASCSAQWLCGGACLVFISLWAPSCGHPESAALGGCPCWGSRGDSFHGGGYPRPRPEQCGSVEGAGIKLVAPAPSCCSGLGGGWWGPQRQLLPAHLGAGPLLLSPAGPLVVPTVAGFLTNFSIQDPFGGQLFLSGAPTFCTHILGVQPG